MHWFWRATIATATAAVVCLALAYVAEYHAETFIALATVVGKQGALSLFFDVPSALVALGVEAWLGSRFSHGDSREEIRCRRCNYILRGITEPRCPECGERV